MALPIFALVGGAINYYVIDPLANRISGPIFDFFQNCIGLFQKK